MKLHARFLLLILLLVSSVAFAQPAYYRSWTLPAETTTPVINTLYQLKNGYILVGATTGLYRFDGNVFSKYTKDKNVSDDVTAICETKNGTVWIGFANGNLAWLQKNKIVLQNPEEGLPKKPIKKIIQDSAGVVWIATAGEGIYYYTSNHFYNINTDDGLSDDYIYDLEINNNRSIAAGTDRGLNLVSLSNGKKNITAYTSKEGLPDNIIRCLYPVTTTINNINTRSLWLGMQDAGVKWFADTSPDLKQQQSWSYGQVNDVLQTGNNLFIATENSGLIEFDVINGRIIPGTPINMIRQKTVAILKGDEGNVWVGGNNQLTRTNGSKLRPLIPLQAKEAADLHTLLIDKENHIWYNSAAGLIAIEKNNDGTWKKKIYKLPITINSQITALHEDAFGNIWIGTMGSGVFLLDPASSRFRKITENAVLSSASILSITGKDDKVWLASLEGAMLCQLNNNNKDIYQPVSLSDFTSISGIGTNYIYTIFTDSKNRTWFATDGKGIAVYEKGKVTNYTQKNGLKSEVVYQFAEDKKGNIWFTTFNAGVVRFDGKQFRYFTTAEGLSDMNGTSMTADKDGNLYITHKKGVDIFNTTTNTITYLDQEQGLTNLNTDLNTITRCSAGNVYFVADNAIYQYDPTGIKTQPSVTLDRIQLFLNDIDVENGHVFSSSQDNISFYYSGLYYSQPGKIQYQYKLEGFGDDWINTSDKRKDFPKLAPGTYTFRVRASLNKNFENASEASFTFTILKPLWMRWWFIAICIILAGLLLYLYVKAREKRINKIERLEKEKIQSKLETLRNQVNPHFLFNSFNTLVSEIEDDPKRAVEYVEHMADFFRNIVNYREKDVISLREETNIIKDYIFIQRKRYGSAFVLSINISNEEADRYYLAPLTLQLLAENAIKHNSILKEKPLVLDIFVEAGQLIVRNNITPKLYKEKSAGLGLQNIEKRYELLTGKAVIISNDDEFFTVIIPLINKPDDKSTDNRR